MMQRETVAEWLERPSTNNFVIGVIILNAIVLGLDTSDTIAGAIGGLLKVIDRLCLMVFIIEIALKLFAYRLGFFRNGWNVFDFVIVGIALVPGAQSLSVLRALRILRVLRVISAAPRLRRVVEGFIRAVPGMASVFLMMAMIFYIGAVMATNLFADSFPEWFGTMGRSAYSLFQIMTLESWSMGIVRPVMAQYEYAWAFFVPFIIVTSFAVVNLLVGLIVNSMQDAHDAETEGATDAYRDEVLTRLRAIEARLPAEDSEK
ncbi:MAG: voltage-gated sodium channel [Rhodobacteraceae bacterium]|nr:voltage-gated sodium channel [Paracoccaceae bacterium]